MRFVYFNDYEVINRERLKLFAKYAKGVVLDVGGRNCQTSFLITQQKLRKFGWWILKKQK